MIRRGLDSFNGKRILMLQGPVGPFFKNLAIDLENRGATVYKVNFNGGDLFCSSSHNAIDFTGRLNEWPEFFRNLLKEFGINAVFLFGDCREHHAIAHSIAAENGIEVGVFEEGYIRPDFITFEEYGVNGNSRMSKDPLFYRYLSDEETMVPHPFAVGKTFWCVAWHAIVYYFFSTLYYPKFYRYRHHRPLHPFEVLYWVRSFWRKQVYRLSESGMEKQLTGEMSKRFYLAPLQISTDAQIVHHSRFDAVEHFLETVIESFANNAPEDTWLVIKHHPLDRGYHDYQKSIRHISKKFGVIDRVKYIHDQHLPTLLDHVKGAVAINSTVGLSAIHHNAPLKVCGTAIYDMEGLTYQGPLEMFWKECDTVHIDRELYEKFRGYLIGHKQINGNFYKALKTSDLKCGILW